MLPLPSSPLHRQRGVTLIELMVALVIGLFIALASAAALMVARQGFTAVDSGSQLRENARFTADLMQRIVVQAGYDDVSAGNLDRDPNSGTSPDDARWPGIRGYDNAWCGALCNPTTLASGSRPTSLTACGSSGSTDTACANASDVLVVRFAGSTDPVTGAADGAIINCAGLPEAYAAPPDPAVETTRGWSVFHLIKTSDGEPALACTYRDSPTATTYTTRTLVKGVEAFQVLYGVDGVTAGVATPPGNAGTHGTTDRFLTASQMEAGSNALILNAWRRVRSVRISLVFRGDVASTPLRETRTWDMRNGGVVDTTKVNAFPAGTYPGDLAGDVLTSPADGRLRQSLVFVVNLRNVQGYDTCVRSVAVPYPC